MLCGMFLRDVERLTEQQKINLPEFRVKSGSKQFNFHVLLDRLPMSRELLNNQFVPIINIYNEDCTLAKYIRKYLNNDDRAIDDFKTAYKNDQAGEFANVTWKSPVWYLHSDLVVLDVKPLYY